MNVENVRSYGHHQFRRSPHVFFAFCPVPSILLLWTILLGHHQDLWLCDLLSDGWHEQPLNEVVEAFVQFLSLRQYHFHLSAILQLQSNFCQLLIPCRHGWNFRVIISMTIWKSCLEFPFELAASNSMHMPSSCCCLSALSFLCTSAFSSW